VIRHSRSRRPIEQEIALMGAGQLGSFFSASLTSRTLGLKAIIKDEITDVVVGHFLEELKRPEVKMKESPCRYFVIYAVRETCFFDLRDLSEAFQNLGF